MPLGPLFWTFGNVSSGFQSHSGQPYSHLAEAYVLHVSWDSPRLEIHLLTSWQPAWQLSHAFQHTCEQSLVGLKTRIYRATATSQCETRQILYRLSYEHWLNLMWFDFQILWSINVVNWPGPIVFCCASSVPCTAPVWAPYSVNKSCSDPVPGSQY